MPRYTKSIPASTLDIDIDGELPDFDVVEIRRIGSDFRVATRIPAPDGSREIVGSLRGNEMPPALRAQLAAALSSFFDSLLGGRGFTRRENVMANRASHGRGE